MHHRSFSNQNILQNGKLALDWIGGNLIWLVRDGSDVKALNISDLDGQRRSEIPLHKNMTFVFKFDIDPYEGMTCLG